MQIDIDDLILAALLSIPGSILGTFLYNRFPQWLDGFNKNRALRRQTRARQQLEQAKHYQDNPAEFTHYLLSRLIRVLGLFAAAGLAGYGMVFFNGALEDIFAIVLVVLLGTSFQLLDTAGVLWQRVSNFTEYEEKVRNQLPQEELLEEEEN